MAPETLSLDPSGRLRPSDSHADMWSLGACAIGTCADGVGMILHKLLFLHLPFETIADYDQLEAEITRYPGFVSLIDV
jgi:serine/threonine protein kinase